MEVGQKEPVSAGIKTTKIKIQNYRCNKILANLVGTVMSTHTVISQYPFTSADKVKYDLNVILIPYRIIGNIFYFNVPYGPL